jgi:CRISPR-associated protein Cas1
VVERIVDLAEEPARLSVRNSLLVIERGAEAELTMPLAEVAALVLSHPQVLLTQPVLARLAGAGATVVVCDGKRMPCGMLLPLAAHFTQGERFGQQTRVSEPLRKRLWQSVVKAKIRAQARVLKELRGDDAGLTELAGKVRSGDPDNVEAKASRRYWAALFDDPAFRRRRFGGDENALLNYGYAVLRAIVARAVCASGLHPSLGLHHHNRYDSFRLADDLMEPFRPIVDRAVAYYCQAYGAGAELDRRAKATLIGALMQRFGVEGEKRTLFDIAQRAAATLAAVFAGERRTLTLPEL